MTTTPPEPPNHDRGDGARPFQENNTPATPHPKFTENTERLLAYYPSIQQERQLPCVRVDAKVDTVPSLFKRLLNLLKRNGPPKVG